MQRVPSVILLENSPYHPPGQHPVRLVLDGGDVQLGRADRLVPARVEEVGRGRAPRVGRRADRAKPSALLADRACRGGGWNYGNANVLGQDLHPYVPTTAVGAARAAGSTGTEPATKAGVALLERAAHFRALGVVAGTGRPGAARARARRRRRATAPFSINCPSPWGSAIMPPPRWRSILFAPTTPMLPSRSDPPFDARADAAGLSRRRLAAPLRRRRLPARRPTTPAQFSVRQRSNGRAVRRPPIIASTSRT